MRPALRVAQLLAVLVALAVASAGPVAACAICLSAFVVAPGQRLDAADAAVLAAPEGDALRVVEVIKGDVGIGERIADAVENPDVLGRTDAEPLPEGMRLLLVHNALAETWRSLGAIDPANAGWLRQVAETTRLGTSRRRAVSGPGAIGNWPELSEAARDARLALVVPYLEHPDPLVAEIAHGEVARSSYRAMTALADRLDAARLRTWIADPELGERRATYLLLLGIAGGPQDAAEIGRRLEAAWMAKDATDLAALLAADLELRGPGRVAWVERAYLADRERTLAEIEAALLALSVHGGADRTVPRDRVVEAYRRFIRERKPMAGFVALDLAGWEAWEATPDYAALIEADLVTDPAAEFAILLYLQRSAQAAARSDD